MSAGNTDSTSGREAATPEGIPDALAEADESVGVELTASAGACSLPAEEQLQKLATISQ